MAFVHNPQLARVVGQHRWKNGVFASAEQSRDKRKTAQPMVAKSIIVSRRTKWAEIHSEMKTQGPYCPLVDQVMLRHCLICAKELRLKKERPQKKEDVQKLLGEARRALGVAQRGRAERFFLRALVVDPGNTKTYFLYALQVQRRDPMLARELFRQGLREDPHDAKLLQAWGLFESKQGKLDRAQRLLKRSVVLEPQHAPVLKWKILFPKDEGRKHYS